MSWLNNWTYRKKIRIKGSSGGDQTDYPVRIEVWKNIPLGVHYKNKLDNVIIVDPKTGDNHAEGVDTDGTYLYSSDRFHIYKMSKQGNILATKSNANLEGTAIAQINAIKVYNDKLIVGCNNYVDAGSWSLPKSGMIKIFNRSDLSFVEEHNTISDHWCEGACKYKGYWWVAYFDYMYISRYDSNWVWQQDYALSQSETMNNGICSDGEKHLYICTTQPANKFNVYSWDGVNFTAIGSISPEYIDDLQSAGFEGNARIYACDKVVSLVDGDINLYEIGLGCDNQCKADFSDIRFAKADGSTLTHFLEYSDANYAVFWVKVDSITASPALADIYLYYGNSGASSASDGATFSAFDGFERGVNGDDVGGDWTIQAGDADISTEQYIGTRSVKIKGTGTTSKITTPFTAGTGYAIRARFYKKTATDEAYILLHPNGTKRIAIFVDSSENLKYKNAAGANTDTGYDITADAWNLIEARNINFTAGTYDIWCNGKLILAGVEMHTATTYADTIYFAVNDTVSGHDLYIDNVIARKFTEDEPMPLYYGSEETGIARVGNTKKKLIAAGLI